MLVCLKVLSYWNLNFDGYIAELHRGETLSIIILEFNFKKLKKYEQNKFYQFIYKK